MDVCHHNYEDSIRMLNQLQTQSMLSLKEKYKGTGLTVMRQFLQRVEVSQSDIDQMRIVHVAGTKGKGSTCAFVESILRRNGIRTGFYSSPHLLEVRERFRIDGKPASTELFTKYFWEVYQHLERTKHAYEIKLPSYFYFLTTMAFYLFKQEKITAVVVEVGIGGTYDCTNVIDNPIVCGISSLGIDHTGILGNTLSSIAWQKSGIFKRNVPVFTVVQPDEGMQVLQERAEELETKLNIVPDLDEYLVADGVIVKLGLAGDHQKINASLALQLANCWFNTCQSPVLRPYLCTPFYINSKFLEGLKLCQWNGRAQVLKFESITFYLDGAHTVRSLQCATKWFQEESQREKLELKKDCEKILSFHITKNRDAYHFLSMLIPCNFNRAIFTPNIATLIPSDFNDQTNLKHPVEDRLIRVLSNRDDWIELCASQNQPANQQNTNVFPCIADAVCWLAKDQDEKLYNRSLSMTTDCQTSSLDLREKHLQVLVTGSLHLVGGYLRILKPDLND